MIVAEDVEKNMASGWDSGCQQTLRGIVKVAAVNGRQAFG